MTNSSLCTLPQELQIEILSNLDAASLTRCAMTCKSIYEIVKASPLLVYIIQLHLDGLKDASMSIGYPDLIKALIQRRQAWLEVEKKEPLTHQMQYGGQAYDLAGGVFVHMGDYHLEVISLPTTGNARGQTPRTLQRPLIGIWARFFAMDPTQDLIIFLEDEADPLSLTGARTLHIHIRTLSTNAIHPLARQSPLQFTNLSNHIQWDNDHSLVLAKIARNTLALAFSSVSEDARLLIWDWTTSDLILDTSTSSNYSLSGRGCDLGLLDSTHHFITSCSEYGSIWLYRLVRSHTVPAQAIHLATLHLPPIYYGSKVIEISCQAGPMEANAPVDALFTINDDDRLHVFTVLYHPVVYVRQWGSDSLSFSLVVHQRVFSKYADQACANGPPLEIPWEEWGPQNTRFTQNTSRSLRDVHGQRVISPKPIIFGYNRVELTSSVEIFDFSLAAVLSAKGILEMPPSSSKGKGKAGTLLPPSRIFSLYFSLFLDAVETHLPCVMSTLGLKETYTAYMIHADGIVGLNMNDDDHPLIHIYTI